MPLPTVLGTEQEPSPAASEQILLPVCNGFELLPVTLEQIPLAVSDGSEPPPVASEQMPLPVALETEQESSSSASE